MFFCILGVFLGDLGFWGVGGIPQEITGNNTAVCRYTYLSFPVCNPNALASRCNTATGRNYSGNVRAWFNQSESSFGGPADPHRTAFCRDSIKFLHHSVHSVPKTFIFIRKVALSNGYDTAIATTACSCSLHFQNEDSCICRIACKPCPNLAKWHFAGFGCG